MSASNTKKKAPKGSVTIQNLRGKLRLRWRVSGEPYVLSLGYPDEPIGLIFTLCFVPSRVSAIAINFFQCTVPATPDRVALVTLEPTRNITGGREIDAQVGSPEQWQRQIQQWIQNPFWDKPVRN